MSKRIILLPEELEILAKEVKDVKALLKSSQTNFEDPILDTEGVMNLLKTSRRTVQKWRDEQIIAFSQINGKFYYRLSAVNDMLNNHLKKQKYGRENG